MNENTEVIQEVGELPSVEKYDWGQETFQGELVIGPFSQEEKLYYQAVVKFMERL